MNKQDHENEVTRAAIALEKAKEGNRHLPQDKRDFIARQAEGCFISATRGLIECQNWEKRNPLIVERNKNLNLTFAEASLRMKEGETFQPTENTHTPVILKPSGFFQATAHDLKTTFNQNYMALVGEIIPAEPEVLKIDQYLLDVAARIKIPASVPTFQDIRNAAETFHQNGRLEMWLELEKAYNEAGGGTIPVFFRTLQNLKPLKSNE